MRKSKRGYLWVTLAFFLISITGHWILAWYAYVREEKQHGETPQVQAYLIETARDTLENWQSEFLQLIWQVGGLAALLFVGSPQSREGDDRKEEKLDEILRLLDPKTAEKTLKRLEDKFPKK